MACLSNCRHPVLAFSRRFQLPFAIKNNILLFDERTNTATGNLRGKHAFVSLRPKQPGPLVLVIKAGGKGRLPTGRFDDAGCLKTRPGGGKGHRRIDKYAMKPLCLTKANLLVLSRIRKAFTPHRHKRQKGLRTPAKLILCT